MKLIDVAGARPAPGIKVWREPCSRCCAMRPASPLRNPDAVGHVPFQPNARMLGEPTW